MTTGATEKPRWKHNCKQIGMCCHYVVSLDGIDLWACNEGKGIVIRWGDSEVDAIQYMNKHDFIRDALAEDEDEPMLAPVLAFLRLSNYLD